MRKFAVAVRPKAISVHVAGAWGYEPPRALMVAADTSNPKRFAMFWMPFFSAVKLMQDQG